MKVDSCSRNCTPAAGIKNASTCGRELWSRYTAAIAKYPTIRCTPQTTTTASPRESHTKPNFTQGQADGIFSNRQPIPRSRRRAVEVGGRDLALRHRQLLAHQHRHPGRLPGHQLHRGLPAPHVGQRILVSIWSATPGARAWPVTRGALSCGQLRRPYVSRSRVLQWPRPLVGAEIGVCVRMCVRMCVRVCVCLCLCPSAARIVPRVVMRMLVDTVTHPGTTWTWWVGRDTKHN